MMIRNEQRQPLSIGLQFFAEGAEGDQGNADPQNSGTGNASQNGGTTFTQEQLDSIVTSRTERAEKAALKDFFKQQGMNEDEAKQAIEAYKTQRQQSQPDPVQIQQELSRAQAVALKSQVNQQATLAAVELGVEAKTIPYLLKMADLKEAANEEGAVDAEKVKSALEKVLEDIPALKPQESSTTGFRQVGASAAGKQTNSQADELAKIFGNT